MEEQNRVEEIVEVEDIPVYDKGLMKKDVKHTGWGLIWYTLINLIVVSMVTVVQVTLFQIKTVDEQLLEQYLTELGNMGTSMIIGVGAGLLLLWLYMRKKVTKEAMFETHGEMTAGKFLKILCVFMTAQFVFSLFASLMEAGLNGIGYSALESIEAATGGSMTISMFLYASSVAPVVEELVYRGFIFRALRKYGKMFAIVTSSILFGVMHANLPQMAFAMAVGFVLAYVTEEYSIKWAIALHIINNFVFAELISFAGTLFGEAVGEGLNGAVVFGFFLAGCVVLFQNRKKVAAYFAENKEERGKYAAAFTTLPFLLFVILNLLLGISMLQPLTS